MNEQASPGPKGMKIVWQKGGEAEIEQCDGNAVVVRSSISAPPGAPLLGTLPSGTEVQIKVNGCKRNGSEGETLRFVIQGRLVNASRVLKDELGVGRTP